MQAAATQCHRVPEVHTGALMTGPRETLRAIGLALVLAFVVGCASRPPVPPGAIPPADYVTPEDEVYGLQVLAQLGRVYPVVQSDSDVNRVRDLVDRLASAAGASGSPWNVYVLSGDDVVNAAATRGNFVFVWTGMLRSTYTDGELATVLAHELGHVLADHTHATPGEEAGQILANVSGNIASSVVATQGPYGALAQLAGLLISETVKAVAVNPEAQRQELEADHIGLFLMADAGFDPREAVAFWSRFSQQNRGASDSLQFFSSHPASEERVVELEALLPAALERYYAATGKKPKSKGRGNRKDTYAVDTFVVGREPQTGPGDVWVVAEPNTPLRSSPGEDSSVVEELPIGQELQVGSQEGRWFQVVSPKKGYIRGRDIRPKSLVNSR